MEHVAIFLKTLAGGGAEKQATLLAKVLSDSYAVHCILWTEAGLEPRYAEILDHAGVKMHILRGNAASKLNSLRKTAVREKIRVLFCYLTAANAIGAIATAGTQCRAVPGLRSSKLPRMKMISDRFVTNRLTCVTVANSFCGRDEFVKHGFKAEKVRVIPNLIDLGPGEAETAAHDGITVISVGRFVDAKDYPSAIRAVALARREVPSLRYKIIGYGELEAEVRAEVKKAGIDDITEILINPPDIDRHLGMADIFLMSSVYEGTSNALLEALRAGLAAVATDVGDNGVILDRGRAGVLVNSGDTEAMAGAIVSLASDPVKRAELTAAGRRVLEKTFSPESFEKQYKLLITQIIK